MKKKPSDGKKVSATVFLDVAQECDKIWFNRLFYKLGHP